MEQGAFAGKYIVTINKDERIIGKNAQLFAKGEIDYSELLRRGGAERDIIKDLLPSKYKDAKKSGLEAEVKAQTDNVFDFELVD